jgi:DNA polymerase III alpha subunit
VIQYIYAKYGRDRAGLAATVITYRARSAIREVGKVFGLSDDAISAISGTKWGGWSREVDAEDARRAGLDPTDKHLAQMLDLASQITGFPRHLSQHVGGFVITRDKLSSLIPIENAAMEDRTIVEWDKDDLESLGMLKIDVLALGMLTCIRKAFALLDTHYGRRETLSSLPDGDRATYDMICRADTIGVFQIESRAQMSMLPRLKPRCYYDLVIEVAIVRPGPIQGDMVHPYLRRRQGREPVSFPKPELEAVLGKTLGVPLFQEQAMNIAIVAGGFSPGEADKLRRAMATFRRVGTIGSFQTKMVEGMVRNGYEREFRRALLPPDRGLRRIWLSGKPCRQLRAACLCLLLAQVPLSGCLLRRHPQLPADGILCPGATVRDAREHGVEIRPVDINCSDWAATLEPDPSPQPLSPRHREMKDVMKHAHAVRLGLQHVKGFGKAEALQLMENRGRGYDSVRDLWMRSGLSRRSIEQLAEADCFRSIGLDRRDALWAVKALDPLSSAERLPLFALADSHDLQKEPDVHLPPMPLGEQVINDYQALSFSLKAHPMSFLRERLAGKGCRPNSDLQDIRSGRQVKVAGLVLVRQRPGSAKGVVFETIEDETGVANIIVWPKVFEKFRAIVLGSRCVGVRGKLQNEDGVIHVVAEYLEDLTPMMAQISDMAGEMGGLANADEVRRPIEDMRPRTKPAARIIRLIREAPELRRDYEELATARSAGRALPKGRNFH